MRLHWLRSASPALAVVTVMALSSAFVLTTGCADDDDGADGDGTDSNGDGDGDGDGDTGTPITIDFAGTINGTAAACGQSYDGVGSASTSVELQDFRFYVSNVRLVDAMGVETPVNLAQNDWQYEDVALLDFEDATGLCADGGNAETNTSISGTVAEGTYTGIVFDLGVPFELNHLDTTAAPSPLNVPSMFWNWQGGHKFARVDFNNGAAVDPGWFIHLGSTGCTSAGPVEAPSDPCAKPNLATIQLDGFDAATNTIVFDAGAAVASSDVSFNTDMTPPGCMSNPAEADDCNPVFAAFGLSFQSGTCDGGCAGQTVFSVQ